MPIREQIRGLFEDRGCPLCGERAWDFEGSRVVVLVDEGALERARRQLKGMGGGSSESEVQKRVFKEASENNRLFKLTCNNCGHTELLDANKIR